jgi:hypothetical protein
MSRGVVGVGLLLAILGVSGSAAQATSGDGEPSVQRFQVHFSPFDLVDVGQPGLSNGDEIVFHDTLLAGNRSAGDEVGSCVIVDAAAVLADCSLVIRLAGGDISGQFANSPPPVKHLSITGGTNRYRTARGEGTLTEAGDGTGTLELRLTT